jgi:ammonia channel protein AmtB
MGISVRRIFALSWSIAAVVSAAGGVLLGTMRGGVDGSLAVLGLKVLPVVIVGGLDSVGGAIVGGLLVGVLADPHMIVYLGAGRHPGFAAAGLLYGNPRQLLVQAGAALTVIVWDGAVTFLILRGIGLFMRLRMTDEELTAGDRVLHGEEAYPAPDPVPLRVPAQAAAAAAAADAGPDDPFPDGEPVLAD